MLKLTGISAPNTAATTAETKKKSIHFIILSTLVTER